MSRIAGGVRHLPLGYDLRYVAATDSTNRLARDLPPAGWQHGTVLFTDYQEEGRGRKGRAWTAPSGSSLLLSLLLNLPDHVSPADLIMAASLAVADAASDAVGIPASLKWPNDVLIRGKKLSGILAEYAPEEGRRRAVLGIGLNVNFDPAEAGIADATGLCAVVGAELDREEVAVVLLTRIDAWYARLVENPDAVFAAWARRLETVGQPVVVLESGESWSGEAIAVERGGGLVVRPVTGSTRVVLAADVSIRRPGSFTTS